MSKDNRDFDSPQYKAWRNSVLVRDEFTCQLTGQKGGKLEVHHIVRWADEPKLRYLVSNGIALSAESHSMVTGKEKIFAEKFKKIIEKKRSHNLRNKPAKYKRRKKRKYRPGNPNIRF